MSIADKINHRARELRGRVKRTVGVISGDRQLEAEGRAGEIAGKLGRADERLKDLLRGRRVRRRRRTW